MELKSKTDRIVELSFRRRGNGIKREIFEHEYVCVCDFVRNEFVFNVRKGLDDPLTTQPSDIPGYKQVLQF